MKVLFAGSRVMSLNALNGSVFIFMNRRRRPGITLLHCMAHARRKFHEALQNNQPRAEYALASFQQLYATERSIKDQALTGHAVVLLRQQEAMPVLQHLKTWMEEEYPKLVVKKSPVAQAMGYFLPRWEKFCIYSGTLAYTLTITSLKMQSDPLRLAGKIICLPAVKLPPTTVPTLPENSPRIPVCLAVLIRC